MTPSTLSPLPSSDQAHGTTNLLEDESCQFGRTAIHGPDVEQVTTDASLQDLRVEPRSDGKEAGKNGLDWPTLIWIAGMHVAALAAPFYFSWSGLV